MAGADKGEVAGADKGGVAGADKGGVAGADKGGAPVDSDMPQLSRPAASVPGGDVLVACLVEFLPELDARKNAFKYPRKR